MGRRGGLHNAGPLAAFLLLLGPFFSHAVQVSMPSRLAVAPTCSLLKDLNGVCQVKSGLGANTTYPSYNGLFMQLGETSCVLTLENCRKNTCYSFRDLTTQGDPEPDPSVVATRGWFADFKIVSGAEGLRWTREGVAFRATGSKVVLQYTTQLCDDYWRVRGRVDQQFCQVPIEAITVIDSETPVSLPCA